MEVLVEIWRRATSEQPAPTPALVALTALVALVLVVQPSAWRFTRMLVTITHEGGHAVAALLAGRRLQGIRLHSDTSGLTVSSGKPTGPGMVVMLMAGYLGPALVGLGAVILLLGGHALALLWIFVLLLALMLLQIRNFYGFAIVVAALAAMVAISWFGSAVVQSTLAYLLTWVLLVAAPKPVVELIGRRGRAGHSALRRRPAGPPHPISGGGVGGAVPGRQHRPGLAVGAAMLLPALLDLVRCSPPRPSPRDQQARRRHDKGSHPPWMGARS